MSADQRSFPAPDMSAENLLDLNHAAALFADGSGRKPHVATLRRWAKAGCRSHRLQTTFLGGRLMTSREAVTRFLAAINGTPPSAAAPPTSAAERAGRELDTILK